MFLVRQIPIVIEPGVAVLEAELHVTDKKAGDRTMAAHFFRVPLDENAAVVLPFVPTAEHPHVFSLSEQVEKSSLLLVYDMLGRLSLVYSRDESTKQAWERHSVIEEHAGKAVTQFSVRFFFNAVKDRNKFLQLVGDMVATTRAGGSISKVEMTEAIGLLSRSRSAPVVLPVAVAKTSLKNIRA